MRDAWREGKSAFTGKHYKETAPAIVGTDTVEGQRISCELAGGGRAEDVAECGKYAQYSNFTSKPAGFAQVRSAPRALAREYGNEIRRHVRSRSM